MSRNVCTFHYKFQILEIYNSIPCQKNPSGPLKSSGGVLLQYCCQLMRLSTSDGLILRFKQTKLRFYWNSYFSHVFGAGAIDTKFGAYSTLIVFFVPSSGSRPRLDAFCDLFLSRVVAVTHHSDYRTSSSREESCGLWLLKQHLTV